MKKMITGALALTLALSAFAGCGGGSNMDGEQFLEVYCIKKGYGTEWLERSLELFQKQDWVKEKYPNLEVDVLIDEDYQTAHQYLSSGKNYNTIDIFFSASLEGYAGAKKKTLANITESVYNSTVPGEGEITVAEKMIDGIYNTMVYGPESYEGEDTFYYFPYVGGNYGILYNASLLEKMQIDVPVTTDEFVAACDVISNKNDSTYNVGYAIADNTKDGYWSHLFEIWWAQYSSMSGFSDFFYGLVGNKQTSDVFKDQGRLESLKVFEEIFRPNKEAGDFGYDASKSVYKYIYPYANEASTNYTLVQSGFLGGKGVFHANGDYFVTEMANYRSDLEALGKKYEFAYMRTPVISSIIDVVPQKSIADDQELAALVRAIDKGETALTGEGYSVEQADYDRVKAARCVVKTGGGNAVIPDYATAKDVAVDLLRFMATDICQEECYVKPAYGLTSAFEYSSDKVASLDKYVSDIHKSRLEIFNSTTLKVDVLPSIDSFPYGIQEFYHYDMTTTTLERLFSAAKETADGIHTKEINYWANAQTKWQQMISGN